MKIIAHRGAKGLAPENTVASLKKALEFEIDGIEFDLRVTKDGVVIIHHDRTLVDPSGNKLEIANSTFIELQSHKPDLATFEEVLAVISKAVPMYVEVKPDVPTQPIIKIIKHCLDTTYKPKHFLLLSFSQNTLEELHQTLPEIPKVVIERWSGVRATYRAKRIQTKTIAMNKKFLWFGFIWIVAHKGYELYAYTLNNPKKARRWAKYGLAGVVTDFPDRFKH